MFLGERIFRNAPGYDRLRFQRTWVFVLAVCLLQVTIQETVHQSLNSSRAFNAQHNSVGSDGNRSSWIYAQRKELNNKQARVKLSKQAITDIQSTLNTHNDVTRSLRTLNQQNFFPSSSSSESLQINPLEKPKSTKPSVSTPNVTPSNNAVPFFLFNVTHLSDNGTNLLNVTHSSNDLNYIQGTSQHLLNRTKHLSSATSKLKTKPSEHNIEHSKPSSEKLHLRASYKKADHNFKARGKRRKYYSSFLGGSHRHHHHRQRRHYNHHHRRTIQRKNLAVSNHRKVARKNASKKKRSVESNSRFLHNGRHPLLRGVSERILLRFKRKSLLEEESEKKNLNSRKKRKRRKRQQALYEDERPRNILGYRLRTPIDVFAKNSNARASKMPLETVSVSFNNGFPANSKAISQTQYEQRITPGKDSVLPFYPAGPTNNQVIEYKGAQNWGGKISEAHQTGKNVKELRQFVPNAPMSSLNTALNGNQFTRKRLPQEISAPLSPVTRTLQPAPAWSSRPPNTALAARGKLYSKFQQPLNMKYWGGSPVYNAASREHLTPAKYKAPASLTPNLYASARDFVYPKPLIYPQITSTEGSPQYSPYPHTGRKFTPLMPSSTARLSKWYSALSGTNSHVPVEGDELRRSRISQGLVVYLNFEGGQGNVADIGKRTEITKSTGSCGKVARLRNGSEILLNEGQMKVKPRQAISIAAWIKLDSNKGFHSIFDTVGGHSLHQSGQYHFEVQDGKLRWFHRNETANQIFSVETDPIIPANVWNHVVGTYDARAGIAKIFVNGRLRAEAPGKGLLSQDWDAHAGIGKHKEQRFLEGEVDEFRIYRNALSQEQIQQLMRVCSFVRGCGGLFYSPTGVIESPDWPNHYRGKTFCMWTISVDPSEKITVRFNNFSLEQDGSCDKAKLVVRDGKSGNDDKLGFYCGRNSPLALSSSANNLNIQFLSAEGAEGKGFHLNYFSGIPQKTKKQETPAPPMDDSQRCAVTRPEYNVTLVGGIKSGTFSEARHVHDMDLCTRHCCLRKSCDLAFMIRDTCYLVGCLNAVLCRTKKARPSPMNPRISFVSHLQAESGEPEMSSAGSAYDKSVNLPTTLPPKVQPRCHHTTVNYNVTLVGGINAGKFSTYGRASTMEECTRHCCHDDKCDLAFMIQGNCYTVECADADGCQVKRAKSSTYNPTVAYVYRGNGKPIGEPLPGVDKPSLDACSNASVSDTIYNVTLRGGMKAGNFTDKGVVTSMSECSAYCCSDDTCNVAFLIRDNCFLVACGDYDSCQVKPALSEYYHPRLAYVNWNPPDDEIPGNRWYASLGCWKDTKAVAMASLEGSDSLLADSYVMREQSIDKCAQVTKKNAFKVFAIQNGGACLGGPGAGRMFNQFGESSLCKEGKGGLFANDVYRITDSGSYISLGCWNGSRGHALPLIKRADFQLNVSYKSRTDPLRKCGDVARSRSFSVFALGGGGICLGGPRAEIDYKKYGISRRCRDGLGGPYANSVYRLLDNLDLEVGPTESTQNSTTPSSISSSTTSTTSAMSSELTPTSQTQFQRTPATSPSPTPQIQENYITLQNGLPHKNSYTASEITYNVTLKYGIKAGKFNDKGKVGNMSDCIRACGRLQTCSVAFMLGKQCFAVSCYTDALCQTKPAFSQFYRPKIAFIKHKKVLVSANASKASSDLVQCRTSEVHDGVTLVGGINAGKFTDLGDVDSIGVCTQRCCMKDTCDVAFMLESECYGVSCVNDTLCETRPARNPERYNPKIAYVYHDKKKDKAVKRPRLRAVIKLIERLLYAKRPRQQTATVFTPVDGKYVDTTDLSVDTDANKQVNNDANKQVNNDVNKQVNNDSSTLPNKLADARQLNSRKIDAQFSTDIFTPTTPQMHYERLVGDINGGQMNVYALPEFFNEGYSKKVPSKSFSTALPPFSMTKASAAVNKGMTGLGIFNLQPSQNSLNNPLKQASLAKKLTQTIDIHPMGLPTGSRPETGFSFDQRTNNRPSDFQPRDAPVDKTWKTLLHKWLKQRLSLLTRHINDTQGNDNNAPPGNYDNNKNDALSLATDLARLKAEFTKLRSRFKQNSITSRNDLTIHSPFYESSYQIEQAINSLFNIFPIAAKQLKSVCWDGEILYNHTLVGGINAGTFSDNGKTENMDICMQFCCKRPSCDLAFMIEDDCYSVACSNNDTCEPRKARPTHYFPRIALRRKPQGDYPMNSGPDNLSSTPATSSSPSTSPTAATSSPTSPPTTGSPTPETQESDSVTANAALNPPVHVAHSCDATPIEHNVTLKMGLHSGVFKKIGKVDSMDDCIEMCCKQPRSDVAFMLGSMCYTVHCYSADLCRTVPIFASSISRLNLNPAISFLKKKARFRANNYLAVQNDGIAQDTCRESTITYNVTLRGGIDAGNFTERPGTETMRDCIGKCCDDSTCDLAFMFGEHCYSVECEDEKLCQAVLAKPSRLEPKISYVARGFIDDKDKGTIFSASDETPTCRADQKYRSKVVSNKTLVGGLEAGKFNFLGVVRNMDMCMDRCCGRQGCNVAYMVDRNCFSVSCYSAPLCKISDIPSTNGDVEISTVKESTAERPPEKHSMVVYVIIGVVGFAAGAGGIVWAVCMFLRRHRLRSRHRQDTE